MVSRKSGRSSIKCGHGTTAIVEEEPPVLLPTKVRQHLNFMETRGYAARDVLAHTRIDAARLSEPTYLVSTEQCHAVVANMIRLTGDTGLGLKSGASTGIADMGIVGYAMASSSTLGEAIGIWVKYGNSPVGGPFTLELAPPDARGYWGAYATSIGIDGAVYRFYVEETFAMGMTFGQLLTGRRLKPKEASFSYPAPPHWRQYKQLFRCPIEFNAPRSGALVTSPTLDAPVRGSDSEMRELCIRHCSLLVHQIEHRGPVSSRLRMFLTTKGRVTDLDGAADALSMSARSLRRHLQEEGTTFQQVLDEFRKDLADEYLRSGAMTAKEIAFLLGFANADSFRRAYKTWAR
jgi:AraC-like DNA-binding protein